MARYRIIAWQEIPAAVEARDGEGQVTRQLSDRFQTLIDSVAMQLGLADADKYLEQWRDLGEVERDGSARDVAEAVAAELEDRFTEFIAHAFRRA